MKSNITIHFEETPNPESYKFTTNQSLSSQPLHYNTPQEAEESPLAFKIFGFPWTAGVSIQNSSVTVTKQNWVDWSILAEPLSQLIKEHLERDEGILNLSFREDSKKKESFHDIQANDSEDVKLIKKLLNEEIRPAVAMDGGDILFHKYEDQRLYVKMRGACSGCPSSMMTLKQGVEARLKQVLPHLKEVIAD